MYPDRPLPDALERISSRRSVKAIDLAEPGPDETILETILETALRVPDHGKLGPWRLVTFSGDDRAAFGGILAARWQVLHPEANDAQINFEKNRFLRAPVVVAVLSERQRAHKIPEWEPKSLGGCQPGWFCRPMADGMVYLRYPHPVTFRER